VTKVSWVHRVGSSGRMEACRPSLEATSDTLWGRLNGPLQHRRHYAAQRVGHLGAVVFFEKVMDLSLLIFTLETEQFCMKCIEFTTRTYNFKNLAVGSLNWGPKTGVNSSYFPQKFSTCPVLCRILTLSASRVAWAYLELL
jgi:hypothetical protein